uniref:G protein-coupled receptor, class C, group 5, member Ba n=1 Tax=Paramormyrops kingsleyae TaxID=1676925 RepID=A0A3B3QPI1_9TELE
MIVLCFSVSVMAFSLSLFIIMFSLVDSSLAQGKTVPGGYMEVVWGVVAAAGGAALASLILAVVLLWRLRRITDAEVRSGVAPLLLLLATIVGLCTLTATYLLDHNEYVCIARRALWGPLFALCFACLIIQGVQLCWLARGTQSPRRCCIVGLAVALAIMDPEWILLINVVHQGRPACQYEALDFILGCTYLLGLLLLAAACSLCMKKLQAKWRAAWLLATCMSSTLLWAGWMTFHLHGKVALGLTDWDDPVQAVVLVAQAWLLLLLHAAPETHAYLRPSPPCPREASNSGAACPGGHQNGNRDNSVEQPIDLVVIVNEEAVSVASHSAANAHTH